MHADFSREVHDRRLGIAEQREIGGRQALVIHVDAVVQHLVHRNLDDARADVVVPEALLEGARQIHPVEAQDHVGVAHDRGSIGSEKHAGRRGVQRMVGRECGAHLEVGEDPRVQRLR